MSVQDIYNYRKANDHLITGGQPTEEQLKSAAEEGFRVIFAANFRATAFYALYALKHLGWPEAEAGQFRASIWRGSDYPVWEKFISAMKASR